MEQDSSPRKIQFTVPLLEPHLDPEAAEQVRSRAGPRGLARPGPATPAWAGGARSPRRVLPRRGALSRTITSVWGSRDPSPTVGAYLPLCLLRPTEGRVRPCDVCPLRGSLSAPRLCGRGPAWGHDPSPRRQARLLHPVSPGQSSEPGGGAERSAGRGSVMGGSLRPWELEEKQLSLSPPTLGAHLAWLQGVVTRGG